MAEVQLQIKKLPIWQREVTPNNGRPTLREDTHTLLQVNGLGTVGLVQKTRPYVSTPADLMLLPFEKEVSQLTELTAEEGRALFAVTADVATTLHTLIGTGVPVIGINQQPDCVLIPEKYAADGTELKVQTIDTLHLHVFVEDGSGWQRGTVGELEALDRYDFVDPFSLIVSELALPIVHAQLGGEGTVDLQTSRFPIGLDIVFSGDISEVLAQPFFFTFLQSLQRELFKVYGDISGLVFHPDGDLRPQQERVLNVQHFLQTADISPYQKRLLVGVVSNLKPRNEEPRKHLRFVQGPALTWVIYQRGRQTHLAMTPRILSRGNAMESFGIWKDHPDENGDANHQRWINDFYWKLISALGKKYTPQPGPLLLSKLTND